MSKNKICEICGKPYEFCGHCQNIDISEMWHNTYCSTECRDICRVLRRYVGHDISTDDAAKEFIKYNYQNKKLKDSVKNVIEDIIKQSTPIKEQDIDSEKQDIEIEEQDIKPVRPRRRRMKKTEE